MAAHAVFGCCVHHAHAAPHAAANEVGHSKCRHSHDGANHSDDVAATGQSDGSESPPAECDEAHCDFLTATWVKAPHPSGSALLFDMPVDAVARSDMAADFLRRPVERSPLWVVVGKRCAPAMTQVWRL